MSLNTDEDDVETRQAACSPIDNAALKKFCCLLKNKADTVLNGKASFTLTTDVLNRFNQDFRRHSISMSENERRPPSACEINSWRPLHRVIANLKKSDQKKEKEKEDRLNDIQFIKDFMLSTPNLKVIHKHRTLSFPISLVRFGNLSILEIRKVPVHLIEGLQHVRGTLESLTIVRSVANLKELLESCGGDRSVPLTWDKLKVLSLVFNEIRHLDPSLRLVSHLESLDLSHNQIVDTGTFLENLVDVSMINLAYNRLTSVPSFSLTLRNSLTSLFLRGNHLDRLIGLEYLTSLEVLDVGENYLVEHSALLPLKELSKLRKLNLDMNPLFYHKRHRRLVVCHLSFRAVGAQFLLDNKKLSSSEIGAYNPHVALRTSPRMLAVNAEINTRTTTPNVAPVHASNLQTHTLSTTSGVGTANSSPDVIATSTPKKGVGKRKRLKARNTEIRDLDTSGDFSSSVDVTPGTSPHPNALDRQMRERREEALQTQREVEKLREDYGSNWLQAIQDRNLFQQPKSITTDSTTETEEDRSGKTTPCLVSMTDETTTDEKREEAQEDDEMDGTANAINTRSEPPNNPTEDDLYLTDTTVDPVNNPIMAAIAKLASGQTDTEDESASGAGVGIESPGVTPKGLESSGANRGELINSMTTDHFGEKGESEATTGGGGGVMSAKKKLNFESSYDVVASGQDHSVTCNQTAGEKSTSPILSSNAQNKERIVKANVKVGGGGGSESKTGFDNTAPSTIPIHLVGSSGSSGGRNSTEDGKRDVGKSGHVPCKPVVLSKDTDKNADWSTDKSTSEMDSSTDNSLQVLENEQESEPMFVSLPESNDAMIIVTLTELFIVEKDVRGKVQEKLDIRSLVSMTTKKTKRQHSGTMVQGDTNTDKDTDKGNNSGIRITLKFSYVRKDRRKRCYLMDVLDAENFRSHLQPFLDAKEEEEKKKKSVIMQCLKCNRSFQKKDVVHRSKDLPTSGSSKDLKVLRQLMETPTLICPRCGSTILIEVELSTPSSKMTSAGSTASTSHSQGSHDSSTGSSVVDMWLPHQQPQLQQQQQQQQVQQSRQQQQQQQQKTPTLQRKPAPMLRNRSFDHCSPQASLAARVARTRKSSVTSVDGMPAVGGRRGNLAKSNLSQSSQSLADGLIEGRDRSNAFAASGQVKMRPSSVTEREEIVPVDDHFTSSSSVENISQQMAQMTRSLRGDNHHHKDLGRKSEGAAGGEDEEKKEEEEGVEKRERERERQVVMASRSSNPAMSDSGFESGVYSSSLGRNAGERPNQVNTTTLTKEQKVSSSNQPESGSHINIESKDPKNEKQERINLSRENKEKAEEKKNGKLQEKNVSGSSTHKHKNLSAMADLVNSLVSEGKDLEEKEMQKKAEAESIHSLYSDDGKKSTISVSDLKRFFPVVSLPVQRTSTGSVDSDIVPLRASPSGNSIAVLDNVQEGVRDNHSAVDTGDETTGSRNETGDKLVRDSSHSKSARFVVGSFENSYEEFSPFSMTRSEHDGDREGRVIGISSPLSSSICNSMVSSVYENLVTTTEDNGGVSNHATLVHKSSVDSTGSEIEKLEVGEGQEEEEEEEHENVPSIYDRSKNMKPIKRKSSKNKNFTGGASSRLEGNSTKQFVDERQNEHERSSVYSDILDRISVGGAGGGGGVFQGQGNSAITSSHPKLQSQSSLSEQLYSNPDLLEKSYGSPTIGGLLSSGPDEYYSCGDGDDDFVDGGGDDDEQDEDEEETFVQGSNTTEVAYRFDRLDHRLTLYLMMTLFENHEEFLCKISCECVAYLVEEAYQSLLVMSSSRFYILKVTDPDTSQEPDKWLSCVEVQPIPELRYIDVGLGGQSLRLEFVTDCSSYTLVTRNRNKTTQFVDVLHNHLAHYAVSEGITSNVVVNEDVDQTTLDNLNSHVLSKVVPDQTLLLYVMGFIERGHYKKFPVSFVVSPSEVCLVRANQQWPQPRLQAPITLQDTGKQFTVLERQKINNVASLEVCEMTLKRVRLELFNETEGVSTIWNITMTTKQATYDFIHAISEPWAREFGVDMDISYSVLDFGK